jgi:hypothetical protein
MNPLLNYRHRVTEATEKVTEHLSFDFLRDFGGSVAKPRRLSEEPEEPRREAVEIDEDVARVGVGQAEPASQRVAVLVH